MFPYTEVPQQLKDTPNWVVWKYETRDGEPTKPPFDAKRNGDKCYAKTNDSTTWASFEQAVAATDVLNGSDYEGPGLVLKGDLQGGDLDGAVETLNNTRVLSPFAASIAKLAGTYCEYSPSRTGLHLIWESPIPLPEGRKQGNHNLGGEIYDKNSSRYFTITGDEVPGLSTGSIRRITDSNTIKLLHFLILSNKIASEKFMRLWTGAWQKTVDAHGQRFPSQSEADLALCGYLVRAGFNTTETVDAAFQHSGMMREEWEHKKKYTIAKALQGKEANTSSASTPPAELVFTLPAVPTTEANDDDYVLDRIPAQSHETDGGWFPRGEVSLIGGPSGAGKTTTTYQILLTQLCGGNFLGHASHGLPFCVMGVDRGPAEHRRTMRQLRMRTDLIPFEGLTLSHDFAAVQQIITKIESYAVKQGALPAIVLVEGVDMLLTKINDILCVSTFMNLLVQVARHYHIAIIGTLGSPKIKVGQEYAYMRDNVLGSGGWARDAVTMIIMQFPQGPRTITKGKRIMTVMPRHGDDEFFTLGFENGQVVQVPDFEDNAAVDSPSEEIEWFQAQFRLAKTDPTKDWWTILDMQRALQMPHSTADLHVKDAFAKKYIRAKSGKTVGKGMAKQYQWNTSKSNPIWVAQQVQDAEEQMEAFS